MAWISEWVILNSRDSKLTQKRSLPGFLKPKHHSELILIHPNGTKRLTFEIWCFGGIITYGTLAVVALGVGLPDVKGPADLYFKILFGFIFSFPVVAFVIWIFVSPTFTVFDRATQTLHFNSHKQDFSIPWRQIGFRTQNFPTKIGSSMELFVVASPPFPETIYQNSPVLSRKIIDQGQPINFGNFRVDNKESASKFAEFFTSFMTSDRSTHEIYQQVFQSPPSDV